MVKLHNGLGTGISQTENKSQGTPVVWMGWSLSQISKKQTKNEVRGSCEREALSNVGCSLATAGKMLSDGHGEMGRVIGKVRFAKGAQGREEASSHGAGRWLPLLSSCVYERRGLHSPGNGLSCAEGSFPGLSVALPLFGDDFLF